LPETYPNRTTSAEYCPATERLGPLSCLLGHFGCRMEDYVAASGHGVRNEHERCDWPVEDLEGDEGYVARDEQNVGFVALEDGVKGGE